MAKRKKNPPSSPTRVKSLMREETALRLRSLRKSYASIGRELSVDTSTAHRLVARGLDRVRQECSEIAATVRDLDLQAIDYMQSRMIAGIQNGDCESVRTALACMERRSKLLGLDMPVKTEAKNENINANADIALYTREEMIVAIKAARERMEAAKKLASAAAQRA
jgi:hypothetical protein